MSLPGRHSLNCTFTKRNDSRKGYIDFSNTKSGIFDNVKKPVYQTCQKIEFLGVIVDSKEINTPLPQEKVLAVIEQCLTCLTCSRAQHDLVLNVPCVLHALKSHVPRALRAVMSHVPHALRVLVLHVPRAINDFAPHVPRVLQTLYSMCPRAL